MDGLVVVASAPASAAPGGLIDQQGDADRATARVVSR